MTARTPGLLNKDGNGRGKKVVTRKVGPQNTRQAAVDPTPIRENYRNLANLRTAELEQLDENAPLTTKAKEFVKFWAQGESVRTAAIKAGYGDGATYAYRLVHHPAALKLYNEEKRKYEEACGMTRKKVMDGLLEAVEMAKLMAEPATMVAGWREVAKMCGYYEPVKKQIDVNLSGNVVMERLNKLSDAELLKLITQEVSNAVEPELLEDESDE